jgi:hypothetical protein
MRQHLPPYIVNCFLAAGFDSPDVIAGMNLTLKPGNSIEIIENYIKEYYPGITKFTTYGFTYV